MSATNFSDNNVNLNLAENYYHNMLKQNFDAMGECLHPEVIFISPLAKMSGRKAVVEAAKNLSKILDNIEIRSKLSSDNQIMFAYDFMFHKPIGQIGAAVLMDFEDGLISKIELFYDPRPFEQK